MPLYGMSREPDSTPGPLLVRPASGTGSVFVPFVVSVLAVMAPTKIGRAQLAVAVAVAPLDHLGEGLAEFIHRHNGVPVGVQLLEPVEQGLAPGIQPQLLRVLEAQVGGRGGVFVAELFEDEPSPQPAMATTKTAVNRAGTILV